MIRMLRFSQSLCLGGILAVAAAVGCGFLTAIGFSLYHELRREQVDVQPAGFSEQVRFLPDGTPFIERRGWYSGDRKFLDRDRNPLEAEPDEPFLESARLSTREYERRQFLFDLFQTGRWLPEGIMQVGSARESENWYFISGDAPADRGYFVGYDVPARRLVGYIGAQGFDRRVIPERHQFPIDPARLAYGSALIRNEDAVYLHSGSQLTLVDLGDRDVRNLTAEVESMNAGATVDVIGPENQPATASRSFIAVRTRTHVEAWGWNGRLLGRYPIPADWASARHLWFYLTASGDAVLSASGEQPVGYVRMGPAGEQSTFQVDLHQSIPRGEKIVSEELELNVITAGVPAPLTAAGFALGIQPWAASTITDASFGAALGNSAAVTWPALLIVFVLAAGLTWLADRRQRDHNLPRSFAWLAFVFVLGLPGWLGYRLHRRWPVREHAPTPSRTGIEVFDRLP